MKDIREWALKHGFKFNPTVDDFLAIARGNAIDFGNEGAPSDASPSMSRSEYDQGDEESGRGQQAGVLAGRDGGVPQDAGQDRRGIGEAFGSPQYATARDGAVSAVARHYSKQQRDSLSGEFYGSGLYGEERGRVANSDDERLKSRIHFYVDRGSGIDPESGVGAQAHEVRLNNLYDVASETCRTALS